MYAVTLIAPPNSRLLKSKLVKNLCEAWEAKDYVYLASDEAAEFIVPKIPTDRWSMWSKFQELKIDLVIQEDKMRKKSILLADMDSTIIQQECIDELASEIGIGEQYQKLLWLAFFSSFAVKTPMWPVHTWLPDAHVEAPTAGSVLLAAILLKMAGYGFIRFSVGLFPIASEYFVPFVFALSLVAIIYTSLVALMQEDMKKLIAYSSVAHMGFVTLGIFTMTQPVSYTHLTLPTNREV